MTNEATNLFFSTHDAALALHKGLAELGSHDAERGRWEWEPPHHIAQQRDCAAQRVRDAVRYLCSEDAQ